MRACVWLALARGRRASAALDAAFQQELMALPFDLAQSSTLTSSVSTGTSAALSAGSPARAGGHRADSPRASAQPEAPQPSAAASSEPSQPLRRVKSCVLVCGDEKGCLRSFELLPFLRKCVAHEVRSPCRKPLRVIVSRALCASGAAQIVPLRKPFPCLYPRRSVQNDFTLPMQKIRRTNEYQQLLYEPFLDVQTCCRLTLSTRAAKASSSATHFTATSARCSPPRS